MAVHRSGFETCQNQERGIRKMSQILAITIYYLLSSTHRVVILT
jgi:hypothetical protein